MIKLIDGPDRERLESLFRDGAAAVPSVPEYWIGGWHEEISFCRECAVKKIAELSVEQPGEEFILDGGWLQESDSAQYCETCERLLDSLLTDYGAEQELDHFLRYGFDAASIEHRRAMHVVMGAIGWEGDLPIQRKCQRLLRRILEDLVAPVGSLPRKAKKQ